MKISTIYVIHHSHTDIGYTERQSVIAADHADYLRQAVQHLAAIDAGRLPGCECFRYQCENDWQVENFLAAATDTEAAMLANYVREGRIGLSASYLNLTELADEPLLRHFYAGARCRAEALGGAMKSAMTADINGYAWGTPDLLEESGTENLYCALHTHHGMFPMNHNPAFFYWRGPRGGRVLTFVGEHYHWGNTLGLCPRGNYSFMIRDEFQDAYDRAAIFDGGEEAAEVQELTMAKTRILRYLDDLEGSGYPLDMVPVLVSGVISDNAPPNPLIARRVQQLNQLLNGRVRLRMAVLDEFFDDLRACGTQIPEYSGDFPDWWADGVGSAPADTAICRGALRTLRLCAKLDPAGKQSDPRLLEEARRNAMLFAEHTWSYSCSCKDPWEMLVRAVSHRKAAYAAMAADASERLLLRLLSGRGRESPRPDSGHRYLVINPHSMPLTLPVSITLSRWEYIDGCPLDNLPALKVRNAHTGEEMVSQTRPSPRGVTVETVVSLKAGEQAELVICRGSRQPTTLDHTPGLGADWTRDMACDPRAQPVDRLETDDFRLTVVPGRGIVSLTDQRTGRELLDPDAPSGLFSALYEVTTEGGSPQAIRRNMGRNRCAFATRRSASQVTNVQVASQGPVYVELQLSGRMDGAQSYTVLLKAYRHLPLITARVRIHKDSVVYPENVLISLPLMMGSETWIDKAGCILRPGIDQLPGTCQAFWLLQNAVIRRGAARDCVVCMPDTPLICLGERSANPVTLCQGDSANLNRGMLWSWVMNNFWETNFNIDLSGFHEFGYHLLLADSCSMDAQFELAAAVNEGLLVTRGASPDAR